MRPHNRAAESDAADSQAADDRTADRGVGRRRVVAGAAAAAALTGLVGVLPTVRPLRAADYPPTEGAMQGFVLKTERRPTPDAPFLDAAGNVRHLSDFRGRTLLVNFWAMWCAPCLRELPTLAALQARLGGPRFRVLAVSVDRDGRETARPFVRERLEIAGLPLYFDRASKLARVHDARQLPKTVLIDPRGRLVGGMVGMAEWDAPGAVRLIEAVMAEAETEGG